MRTFNNDRVGLRDKETGDLIAVYPDNVTGSLDDVKKEVFDWYYKTSCSAEEIMRNCIVDDLSDNELKNLKGLQPQNNQTCGNGSDQVCR